MDYPGLYYEYNESWGLFFRGLVKISVSTLNVTKYYNNELNAERFLMNVYSLSDSLIETLIIKGS